MKYFKTEMYCPIFFLDLNAKGTKTEIRKSGLPDFKLVCEIREGEFNCL